MNRLTRLLDHSWAVLGGVASWVHCLTADDRLARWLRTNEDYEPEVVG